MSEISKARQALCPHPSDVSWNYLLGKVQKSAGVWRPYCSHCYKWLTKEEAGPGLVWTPSQPSQFITQQMIPNQLSYAPREKT